MKAYCRRAKVGKGLPTFFIYSYLNCLSVVTSHNARDILVLCVNLIKLLRVSLEITGEDSVGSTFTFRVLFL